MANFRHGTSGTMTSSKKIVISDALPSAAGDTDFSLIQPKDTIVDEVFIRILEAPVVASGNIVFKISGTAGTAFGDFATGDAASETAHDTLKTADTVLHGRIKTSTAASTAGKLEVHVVFRYFD